MDFCARGHNGWRMTIAPSALIVLLLFAPAGSGANAPPTTNADVADGEEFNEKELRISEYILGEGDEIAVSVFRHSEFDKQAQIPSHGTLFFPLVGEIEVNGLGAREFRERFTEELSRYVIKPQVEVEITAHRSQKIFVLGEVRRPGIYSSGGAIDSFEAIAMAGGFTVDAKRKNVLLIRGDLNDPNLYSLDLKQGLQQGDLTQNALLQRGDVLYVPASNIVKTARFFSHIERIIRPFLLFEQGVLLYDEVENVLLHGTGEDGDTVVIVAP